MAEESDAEKTEPASQKRLDQAREEGDVPRSRELATFAVLMGAGAGLWITGGGIMKSLNTAMVSGLALTREQVYNPDVLIRRVGSDIADVLITCLPVAFAVMLVALAAPLMIGGFLFSAKSFMPNFGKLNPARGLGNMISKNSLVELLKAIATVGGQLRSGQLLPHQGVNLAQVLLKLFDLAGFKPLDHH